MRFIRYASELLSTPASNTISIDCERFTVSEVDGGSMSTSTIQQNPSLMDKVYFHTVITVPKGRYVPPYSRETPEIDSFAKSEMEHRLLNLYRSFDYPRWPYIVPPGTPKELVNVLRDAMVKSFKDPGFAKEFKKLTGVDPGNNCTEQSADSHPEHSRHAVKGLRGQVKQSHFIVGMNEHTRRVRPLRERSS